MSAIWVTVDVFAQQTGIHKDEAQRKCRSNEWPQGIAWMYYSEKIRLINLNWWNRKWDKMARVYVKQQKEASKSSSSSPIEVSAAWDASSASQLKELLEK